MEINLTSLHNNLIDELEIDNTYKIDKEYYKNTDIIYLSEVKIKGIITRKENEDNELDDFIECTITGTMIIPDSISLEEVEYPYNIEYSGFFEENSKKSENVLDILAFLWENILLEVPLQFTKVSDLSKFHGDGWRLLTEEDKNLENNPFSDLLKDFEKE